jgi:CHAT domain-containing protein/Flp pilus assembly protein TadD
MTLTKWRITVSVVLCALTVQVGPAQIQRNRRGDRVVAQESRTKNNAERLVRQARKLASEWDKSKITEAIRNYNKAQLIYQAIGDVSNQLFVLLEMGQAQESSGDLSAALLSYERALSLSSHFRQQLFEAAALNRLGFFYIERSEFEKALELAERAHQLSLSIGDGKNRAQALLLLGTGNYHVRKVAEAKKYLQASLELLEKIDSPDRCAALEMLGHLSHELGDPKEAMRLFSESLALASRINNLQEIGKALNGIAISHSILGEKQQAVESYRRAQAIFEKMGNRRHAAVALNGLGYIYYTVAQYEPALNYYSRALKFFRSVNDREGESIALARTAKISEELWGKKTAAPQYEQLLIIARQLKDPIFESYVMNWLGDAYLSSDVRRALDYYAQALSLSRLHRNPRIEAHTLNRLGYGYASLGETDSAKNFYSSALQRMQIIFDREGESMTLYNLAVLERAQDRMGEARVLIERSLNIVESLTTDVGDRALRASYFATAHQQYEFYIDVLMQLHKRDPSAGLDLKALEASERSRARSLVEMLGETGADIRQGVDPELLEQEGNTKDKLSKAIQKRQMIVARIHTKQEIDDSEQEIVELTTEYEQIASVIRKKSPQYAALTQPTSLTAAQIQQLLDEDSVMIEYALGDKKSFAWTITSDSIRSFELPERAKLEQLVRVVYDELARTERDGTITKRPAGYSAAIESLSKFLLDCISEYHGKKRVIVIADGVLHYLPFSTLQVSNVTSDRRLIAHQEIVNLPSASALAVQRSVLKDRSTAPRMLAIVADPVFEVDDSRILEARSDRGAVQQLQMRTYRNSGDVSRGSGLRGSDVSKLGRVLRDVQAGNGLRGLRRLFFSRQEANDVFRLISPAEGMKALDFQASRKMIVNHELAEYRMLHFATHGLLDNQFPELSGIVLSMFDEQGRPQNGFLQLYEIYNLRLSADLVVLSACQTGLGKNIKGEGIVGLTRGFMHAGSRRVVASLWKVDDAATAQLMVRFYRQMIVNGLKPAAALRAAQLDLSKENRYRNPYFWAGFVIQGEWN